MDMKKMTWLIETNVVPARYLFTVLVKETLRSDISDNVSLTVSLQQTCMTISSLNGRRTWRLFTS